MTDIVEKLRSQAADAVDAHGETMKKWDEIRAACLTYRGSDLPRLMFESLMDDLAETMMEAFDEIERLRAQVNAAREFVKRHPALTLIDLAEFEVFLKVMDAIAPALPSTK